MNTVCVYTAIAGGYDELKSHPDTPGVDWICFTDDPALRSDEWDVRPLVETGWGHATRLAAKWHKVLNHLALPSGYDQSIWIDGSVKILNPDFVTSVLSLLDGSDIALFAHPERNCIYDEAVASLDYCKYDACDVLGQVREYRYKGYPRRNGLWAGGIIGRDHRAHMRAVMDDWWSEILKWGFQDQLSLPVVLDRFSIWPTVIPGNLYDNRFLKVDFAGHKTDL
jgi:hypothetical protein